MEWDNQKKESYLGYRLIAVGRELDAGCGEVAFFCDSTLNAVKKKEKKRKKSCMYFSVIDSVAEEHMEPHCRIASLLMVKIVITSS